MPNFVGTPSCYPQLIELRKSKTASFKSNKYLKETTKLRYYQVIGALHMMMLERMVLGDSTGLGKCVSEETYINTSKGLIKIKELLKGGMKEDTFYFLSGLDILSINEIKRPSLLYISGRKKGLKITTNNGFELEGLNHHPILFAGLDKPEFKKLSELKEGDYVCINRHGIFPKNSFRFNARENIARNLSKNSNEYKTPAKMDNNLAELLGYFISEGRSSIDRTFTVTQIEKEINDRIRQLLKTCFNYEQSKDCKNYEKSIVVSSIHIVKYLESIGINVQAKSADKVIPWSILEAPMEKVRAFLRGYFEGDGGVELKNEGVSCSSKSEELIRQMQLLLLSFGIVSRRYKKMVKVKKERRLYWVLIFFGKNVDIFKEKISFVSSRKNKELDAVTSNIKRNTNLDIIPFGGVLIKEAMKDIIKYLRTVPEHKNFSIKGSGWKGLVGYKFKRNLESNIFNRRKLTYERLKDFINILDIKGLSEHVRNYPLLKDILNKNLFFDKIVKIEECKSMFVDLHVPETHNFTGNGFVNHNTIQTISAYSFLLEKDPTLKLLVVTPKSATFQWAEEFEKFTQGISVRVISSSYHGLTGFNARKAQYENLKENVMIINYDPLINEYEYVKDALKPNYMVVLDEVTAVKSRKAQRSLACKEIADTANRVYGLSATIIKNGLEEVFCIYDVVVPGLFGKITKFRDTYCIQELMRLHINGRERRIPKTVGYKNIPQFKQVLDPYFLIRRKEEVATELPKLISRKIVLEMYPEQKDLYRQALSGILYEEKVKQEFFEISDKIRLGANDEKSLQRFAELKEKYDKFMTTEGRKRGKLAAITYCQMISDGPKLLNQPYDSSKEDEFRRLIKEELLNEKIIIFSRFKNAIHTLRMICEQNGVEYTKITGDENDKERQQNRLKFQSDPKCNLIFITTAGSASLNLQAAGVLIFYDTPWSYGDLVQTIGRAQRIGSIQEHVLIIHLINKGTIDIRVMNKVSDKKEISDQVLGDTAQGALDFTTNEDKMVDDLYQDLLKDAEAL